MEKSGGKIFLNIVKILLSIFLSGLFVIVAFVFPVYYATVGMVKPDSVVKVVQNIDFVEILKESKEFNATMNELGLDIQTVDEIIKSDAVGNFLEGFAGIVTDVVISGNPEDFSIDALKDMAENHIDDIAAVLDENLDTPIKKEDVQGVLNEIIDNNSDAIKETVAEFTADNPAANVYRTVQKTLTLPVIIIVTLTLIVILGLIYLLRAKKYGGFIWLAVDSGIVMLMLAVAAIIINSGLFSFVIAEMPSALSNVAASALGIITTKLIIAIAVLFVIVAASITAFILLRKNAKRKLAAAVEEAPAVEETPAAEEAEITDEAITE
ncbi:MAG: hypothetical protein E7545_02975 [Ruminococcaceae bacterium]|nr:hypothetical protein [Oscillospiraceae bacterium]